MKTQQKYSLKTKNHNKTEHQKIATLNKHMLCVFSKETKKRKITQQYMSAHIYTVKKNNNKYIYIYIYIYIKNKQIT